MPFKDMPLNKLVRYFMRQGRHQTTYKYCLKAFSELYGILLRDSSLATFDRLGGYSPVAGEFLQSQRFYNPNALIYWLAWKSRQTFALKCFATPKQQKKRRKTDFSVSLITVHPQARVNIALRSFHFFTEEQQRMQFDQRIFFSLLDGLFKYKNGLFQKRRARLYKLALVKARNHGEG